MVCHKEIFDVQRDFKSKVSFFLIPFALIFPTISCFFIGSVFKIREHGIQARENKRIYSQKPVCDSRDKNFGSVRLTDCYAAILILIYGFALSFGIFLIEKLMKYRKQLICNGIHLR